MQDSVKAVPICDSLNTQFFLSSKLNVKLLKFYPLLSKDDVILINYAWATHESPCDPCFVSHIKGINLSICLRVPINHPALRALPLADGNHYFVDATSYVNG